MAFFKSNKKKNTPHQGAIARFDVDKMGLSDEEKQELWSAFETKTGITSYYGHVEHGYALKSVSNPARCPRCQASTERHYANFIYATQAATRVMFAPAGFFCTRCPTVIIDEDMIASGVMGGYKFRGVVGLDHGGGKELDAFKTWNGEEVIYFLDEHEQITGLGPLRPSFLRPAEQRKPIRTRPKKRLAKESRRRNRPRK